jgi:hypothetical protein
VSSLAYLLTLGALTSCGAGKLMKQVWNLAAAAVADSPNVYHQYVADMENHYVAVRAVVALHICGLTVHL